MYLISLISFLCVLGAAACGLIAIGFLMSAVCCMFIGEERWPLLGAGGAVFGLLAGALAHVAVGLST